MGTSVAIFALIGAVVSSNVPDGVLLAVFATMALIASGLFGLQALRMTMRPKQPHSARLWRLHLEPSWGFTGVLDGQGRFVHPDTP